MRWPIVTQEHPQYGEGWWSESESLQPRLQHTCLTCICCMLFGVTPDSDRWVDAPMSPARVFTCLPRCAAIIDCGGPRAFLQCTPICAFLSRRIDRRSLFPSQSSLLLTTNISHPVSSPHKTFARPLPDLTSVIIHSTHTPHLRLIIPASQTHPLTPRTNRTNTHQSSTWAR